MSKSQTSFTVKNAEDKKSWDNFITSHPEANFLQSWDFYEFHRSRGKKIVRRIFQNTKGEISAAYAGVIETAKRGTHLAVAGGPIMDFSDSKLVNQVFADIKSEATKHRCVFVRVRPQIEYTEQNQQIFCDHHFKKAPMYLSVDHAGILDLTKDESEIKKNMRTRLKRALKKAEKYGIIVEKSTDSKNIETFYQIQLETASRHHFVSFSQDFLQKQFAAFAPHDEAVLYTAKFDGKILAQNFMIFYGNEASYHYGVSSALGTEMSGAPLLHLEAMRDARKRGIKRYNFWGIVPEDAKRHRFYGVSSFKRGFGVAELKYLPAQDLILNPAKYILNWLVETARRKLRHV